MKIISVDKVIIYPEHVKELKKLGEVVIYSDIPSQEEGIKRIKDADIVIDNWYEMPANVIASAPKLKMICVAATGYEWVDLKEAKKRRITVCNSPGYSTEAVAEHTVGLLLNAARLASKAERSIRKGKWDPILFKGKEFKGKTLGVIGYGNIGKRVAEICQKGFGMKIISINSKSSRKDLEKLLSQSDFISLNMPLTDKTKRMIGEEEFKLMEKGVVIANTGRGAVIDEKAFVKNLKSGKVFAAGLDVLEKEPMDGKALLFSLENTVITQHIAYNTQEAEYRLSEIVTENVKKYLAGKPQNIVSK